MTPVNLNILSGLKLLRKTAEKYGTDTVYQREEFDGAKAGCAYVHGVTFTEDPDNGSKSVACFDNASVGCLIGAALHEAGVPFKDIIGEEAHRNHNTGAGSILDALERQGQVYADDDTAMLFSDVQAAQDGGKSWGEAIDYAEELMISRLNNRARYERQRREAARVSE